MGDEAGGVVERHLETVFRSVLRGPESVHEAGFVRLLTGEPHPFGNLAVVAGPADPATTWAAVEPLVSAGVPAAALFPSSRIGPEVGAYLEGAGFESHGPMPAMAADIEGLAETSLPDGYEFARTVEPSRAEAWAACLAVGYGLPEPVARLFSPVALEADGAPDAPVQFFAIQRGEAIVATSLVYLEDGVAGVYCVATVPEERGKGLGAHVTAEALRSVRGLGYRVGVLQSSEMGHGVYRRLGFRDCGGVPMYIRVPAD
jgi:GNAT superfamily N-acetyltransferase